MRYNLTANSRQTVGFEGRVYVSAAHGLQSGRMMLDGIILQPYTRFFERISDSHWERKKIHVFCFRILSSDIII